MTARRWSPREVHAMLQQRHPGLLTIIVPRHPERAEALVEADLPAWA